MPKSFKMLIRSISLLIALILLASCSSVSPAEETFDLNGIAKNKGAVVEDLYNTLGKRYKGDEYRNCAVTSFDMPGQGVRLAGTGVRMAGTVGGLIISEPDTVVSNFPASTMGRYMKDFSDYPAEHDVGIIVLDQFSYEGKDAYELGDIYKLVDAAQFVPFAGPEVLEDTFYALRESGQLSHGALVLHHTKGIVETYPDTYLDWASRDGSTTFYERKGKRVAVQAVDVKDLDTDNIANALQGAVRELRAKGIHKYSVNMSFAIVPCALNELVQDEGYRDIETYLDDIKRQADAAGVDFDPEEFMNIMSWVTARTGDPLLETIQRTYTYTGSNAQAPVSYFNNNREDIAFVAAAGNFKGSIPLLPAYAADVISVSSLDLTRYHKDSHPVSAFTNAGEVGAPGWLFGIPKAETIGTFDERVRSISYAGSSFASPAVAVYSAFDLAQPEPVCFSDGAPSDLLTRSYDNKKLIDHVKYSCP